MDLELGMLEVLSISIVLDNISKLDVVIKLDIAAEVDMLVGLNTAELLCDVVEL